MGRYIPRLRQVSLKNSKMRPLASNSTYYNKAKDCFDVGEGHATVGAMLGDRDFRRKVEGCLQIWPPGTIGIHTVKVTYQISGKQNDGRKERGGRLAIILMIERKIGPEKHKTFTALPIIAKHDKTTKAVKDFILSLEERPRLVRLVTDQDGKPTTANLYEMQKALGDIAMVEPDEPTKGLIEHFRIPGRFTSKKALLDYLCGLQEHGYKYKRQR